MGYLQWRLFHLLFDMQQAVAGFGLEDGALLFDGVDEVLLRRISLSEPLIKRGVVRIAAAGEFGDQGLMALVERPLLPHPAQGLGVAAVAALALVLGENIPEAVQLAMFGEQMLAAQVLRVYVPDAHRLFILNNCQNI